MIWRQVEGKKVVTIEGPDWKTVRSIRFSKLSWIIWLFSAGLHTRVCHECQSVIDENPNATLPETERANFRQSMQVHRMKKLHKPFTSQHISLLKSFRKRIRQLLADY